MEMRKQTVHLPVSCIRLCIVWTGDIIDDFLTVIHCYKRENMSVKTDNVCLGELCCWMLEQKVLHI